MLKSIPCFFYVNLKGDAETTPGNLRKSHIIIKSISVLNPNVFMPFILSHSNVLAINNISLGDVATNVMPISARAGKS